MEGEPTRTRLSFSIRTVLEVIAIVALVLALLYGRVDDFMSRNGRYQVYRGEVSEHGVERVLLLDTKTGKLWVSSEHYANYMMQWHAVEPVEQSNAPPTAPVGNP